MSGRWRASPDAVAQAADVLMAAADCLITRAADETRARRSALENCPAEEHAWRRERMERAERALALAGDVERGADALSHRSRELAHEHAGQAVQRLAAM